MSGIECGTRYLVTYVRRNEYKWARSKPSNQSGEVRKNDRPLRVHSQITQPSDSNAALSPPALLDATCGDGHEPRSASPALSSPADGSSLSAGGRGIGMAGLPGGFTRRFQGVTCPRLIILPTLPLVGTGSTQTPAWKREALAGKRYALVSSIPTLRRARLARRRPFGATPWE